MAAAPVPGVANSGAQGFATGVRWLVPWLIAAGAVTALVVVLLAAAHPAGGAAPVLQAQPAVVHRSLPARAGAATVKRMFGLMKPFVVQPNMGASNGKDATCSIYSDGNPDTGAHVTWAVTLCVVERIASGS